MAEVQSPISEFILLSYKEPGILGNDNLRIKIENFVDLLKIKIETKGIEYSEQILRNELFDLRLELLDFLKTNVEILDYFEKRILEEIHNKYFTNSKYKELGIVVSDTLEVYLNIFQKFSNLFGENTYRLDHFDKHSFPSLIGLKHMLHLQPNPDLDLMIKWIESSIAYDYYLIVSDLVFYDKILLDKEINLLKEKVELSIIDFGVYSILTGFWYPKTNEDSRLIRKSITKAAQYEFANKFPNTTRKKLKFGSAKGKIRIASDFDEPLDDFKEYMR